VRTIREVFEIGNMKLVYPTGQLPGPVDFQQHGGEYITRAKHRQDGHGHCRKKSAKHDCVSAIGSRGEKSQRYRSAGS